MQVDRPRRVVAIRVNARESPNAYFIGGSPVGWGSGREAKIVVDSGLRQNLRSTVERSILRQSRRLAQPVPIHSSGVFQ